MGFLSGIKVIDATYGLAGPIATQVLVDFGAEIVRIDKPNAQRRPDDLVRLRGRRSIAIDLSRPEAGVVLERLLTTADILITEPALDGRDPIATQFTNGPSSTAPLRIHGEGRATAGVRFPRLIWLRITGYGDEGPMAGGWAHDRLVAARYGVYDQPGFREGPTFVTGSIPSLGAGLLAAQAIGTALYQRERTGKGQEVMVSLLAGALAFQPSIVSASIDPPGGIPPPPTRRPAGAAPFYSIYECAGGRYLHFGCLTPQFQRNAISALGLVAELEALGFGTAAGRENTAQIIETVAGRMRQRPYDEWAADFEAADVPYAEPQWTEDLLHDAQVAHEGLAVEIQDPTVGPMTQMGPVASVDGYEWQKPSPAPLPGQHTDAICRELGLSDDEIAGLRKSGVVA